MYSVIPRPQPSPEGMSAKPTGGNEYSFDVAQSDVAGPSPVFRSKITTATMVVVFRIRQSLPRPLCFPTIPVSPTLHPYFPHLTHQEQKRPSTQYFFLICNIGKPAPCPTLPSVAHPCFPHLTLREQKPPSTQLSFPICYIGSKNRLPRSISSSSVTSGAKTAFHAVFLPHL